MLNLDPDTRRLISRLTRIINHSPAIVRRAANSTAWYLRDETPDILDRHIDRGGIRATMSERSYTVGMDRNRGDEDINATLRAKPHVNSYLRKIQFGLADDYNNRPVVDPTAFTAQGNLKRRFYYKPGQSALMSRTIKDKRWNRTSPTVAKYFYGRFADGTKALFERYDGNKKIRTIAVQEFNRQNRKTLPLLDEWHAIGRPKFLRNIRYWAGRFLQDPDSQLPPDLRVRRGRR